FDLAGWSSGAAVSLAFALEYPERVRTLTLIEPPALWVLRDTEYDGRFHEEEMADRKLAGKEITVDDLKAFLVRAGLGGPDTDFESHPRWQVMLRNRAALSVNAIAWDYADSIERLRALQIPILLVRGKETSDLLGAPTTIIAATAPNATVLELPGGHACHLENPDRFLEAFEAHLASAAGG
ncbi:MAG: alpha/beta fold hydrolase, partial [Thermomicrobiales bacterium]